MRTAQGPVPRVWCAPGCSKHWAGAQGEPLCRKIEKASPAPPIPPSQYPPQTGGAGTSSSFQTHNLFKHKIITSALDDQYKEKW